jgi:hypothetical protein
LSIKLKPRFCFVNPAGKYQSVFIKRITIGVYELDVNWQGNKKKAYIKAISHELAFGFGNFVY